MKKYYITCHSYPVCYREPDPDDEWDNGDDGYEGHSFEVATEKPNYYDQTFETDMDDPYFVAVIYSTGCTFGRTDGVVSYIGPFTKEEAEINAKRLEDSNGNDYSGMTKYGVDWIGYFERYQECQIICENKKENKFWSE